MYVINHILKMRRIYKTIVIYLVLGSLWILLSDKILNNLISDKEMLTKFQTYKGWFFIISTALIMFFILKNYFNKIVENELRMRKLLNNSPDFVIQLDPKLKYLYVNQVMENIFGKSKEELIGKDVSVFNFSSKIIKKRNANIKKVFETGKERRFELTYPVKGEKRIFDIRVVPQYEKNKITSVLYIGRDITQLKNKEKRIKQLNKILLTIRNVNQMIAQTNDLEKLLNKSCELFIETRGFLLSAIGIFKNGEKKLENFYFSKKTKKKNKIEKIVKKNCNYLVEKLKTQKEIIVIEKPPENCKEFYLFSKPGKVILSRLKHKNEIYGLLLVKVSNDFKINKYEIDLFKEISGDIAFSIYRLKMEEKLKSVEFKYKNLFNSLLSGIAVSKLVSSKDKLEDLILIDANKKFLNIINSDSKKFKNESLFGYIPELKKVLPVIIDDLMKNDKNKYFEMYSSKLNKYLQVYIYNLKENKIVLILFDKTNEVENRKNEIKMEKRIQHKQKMESLGTLAGGIAHDFNNIIFAISGNLKLISNKMDDTEKSYDYLTNALKATKRAEDLVRQILTFSKKENIEYELLYLQDILEEVLNLIRSSFPKTITIKSEIDYECNPIYADETQMHQVIMNLITNSFQAMNKKGILWVSLKSKKLEVEKKETLVLSIRDNGVGMDKDIIGKIFDPFFTTKEKNQGTGLGLSVVQNIIKKLNGRIKVESEPNVGTEFNIILPTIKDIEKRKIKMKQEKNVDVEGIKIMFVDDEEMIADMVKESLEDEDLVIDVFTSPNHAIKVFNENTEYYDLIVTDLTMPEISGLELIKNLKKKRTDVPIILSTGSLDETLETKAREIGVTKIIKKPFSFKKLLKMIKETIKESD